MHDAVFRAFGLAFLTAATYGATAGWPTSVVVGLAIVGQACFTY